MLRTSVPVEDGHSHGDGDPMDHRGPTEDGDSKYDVDPTEDRAPTAGGDPAEDGNPTEDGDPTEVGDPQEDGDLSKSPYTHFRPQNQLTGRYVRVNWWIGTLFGGTAKHVCVV